MKYKLLIIPALLILLTGAGCDTKKETEIDKTNSGVNTELEKTLNKASESPEVTASESPEEPSEEPMKKNNEEVSLEDFKKPPKEHPGILKEEDRLNKTVVIETTLGDITIELFGEEAPLTVSNFLVLANTGYYDDIIFHRIIKGFMIQGGDPTGTGMGGPGYKFADELGGEHKDYKKGIVAMANSGPDTNGSQFFMMDSDYSLENNYTIFGKITKGQDVIDKMANLKTDSNDRPEEPPSIKSITIK